MIYFENLAVVFVTDKLLVNNISKISNIFSIHYFLINNNTNQ